MATPETAIGTPVAKQQLPREFRAIGKRPIRHDGVDKITGKRSRKLPLSPGRVSEGLEPI